MACTGRVHPGHGTMSTRPRPPTSAQELRVYGNKCLDVNGAGTANGTSVIIWDCHGQANQQWRFNADGTITAVGSGRCLDLVNGGTANGTRTQIWDCTGAAGQ